MYAQYAAVMASIILLIVCVFQVMLILGYPLGRYAWGGSHKVLPLKLRISSAVSTLIYLFCALIILESANLIVVFKNETFLKYLMWFLTAFFGLGILLNLMSRSKRERLVMTPVVFLLTIFYFIVALN